MLRLGAAGLVGAGLSLAAVRYAERRQTRIIARAAREAREGSPALADMHSPQAGQYRDASCDWGSPLHPAEREGNKTVSPSRLPRPRQLFSDRDHKANEVP